MTFDLNLFTLLTLTHAINTFHHFLLYSQHPFYFFSATVIVGSRQAINHDVIYSASREGFFDWPVLCHVNLQKAGPRHLQGHEMGKLSSVQPVIAIVIIIIIIITTHHRCPPTSSSTYLYYINFPLSHSQSKFDIIVITSKLLTP